MGPSRDGQQLAVNPPLGSSQSWEGFNYITNARYFYCQILLLLAMLQILTLSFIKLVVSLVFYSDVMLW